MSVCVIIVTFVCRILSDNVCLCGLPDYCSVSVVPKQSPPLNGPPVHLVVSQARKCDSSEGQPINSRRVKEIIIIILTVLQPIIMYPS